MNATPLEPLAFGIGNISVTQFARSFMDSEFGSSSHSAGLLYLLPPCLIMLAVDALAHYSNRQAQITDKEKSARHKELVEKLTARVHRSVLKIQELDRQLLSEQALSKSLSRSLRKRKNFARHRERLEAYKAQLDSETDSPPRYTATTTPTPAPAPAPAQVPAATDKPSAPFTDFCQKLLYQNEIWKQQREIKKLQLALHDIKSTTSSNAFQAFCDRLLLSNKIWKQQREINSLMAEAESLRRSRVAAVTRAAKQMVQDVMKERLTEEYVKDLIAEVGECKQAISSLRAEHEREIRELADLYRQDCQKMARKIELLKLAQESRRVEQDLSNEMEDGLIGRLSLAEEKLLAFETQSVPAEAVCESDVDETLSETELERISNMSTSTYVGSAGDISPNRKSTFEESSDQVSKKLGKTVLSPLKLVLQETPSSPLHSSATKSPNRKLDPGAYAGFSFNPLFYGNATSPRIEDRIGQGGVERRSTGFSLRTPPLNPDQSRHGKSKAVEHGDQTPRRAQWRF